jgi:hypothetical protein
MSNIDEQLKLLTAEQIIEAANAVLPARLGIDDPTEAATKILSTADGIKCDPNTLTKLARGASKESPKEIAELLRAVMGEIASGAKSDRDSVARAVEAAGDKQTVIGPDLIVIAVLSLVGYVIVKSQGKIREEENTEISQDKDGQVQIKTHKKTFYIDPFGSLGKLLKMLLPNLGKDKS